MLAKILPKKLRHRYYYWKSKQLPWKKGVFCSCGYASIPKWYFVGEELILSYWEKLNNMVCDNCNSTKEQYLIIKDNDHGGVYCNACRFEYSTDYFGVYPRGKKYKGESYSN